MCRWNQRRRFSGSELRIANSSRKDVGLLVATFRQEELIRPNTFGKKLMMNRSLILPTLLLFVVPNFVLRFTSADAQVPTSPRITLVRDDAEGQLQVMIDGKEAIVYCYGDGRDLAHYFPVRSPSGKSMTV